MFSFPLFASTCGEASSKPHLRSPSVRPLVLKKYIQSVLQSRDDGGSIDPGDIYALSDSGKHGLETALLSGFLKSNGKPMSKEKRTPTITYLEEDIREKRALDRVTDVDQVESMHFVTWGKFEIKPKSRPHWEGTSSGTWLGPVAVPKKGAMALNS